MGQVCFNKTLIIETGGELKWPAGHSVSNLDLIYSFIFQLKFYKYLFIFICYYIHFQREGTVLLLDKLCIRESNQSADIIWGRKITH